MSGFISTCDRQGYKDALMKLVDRVMRKTKIKALPNHPADQVTQACIGLFSQERPHSITFDNGKEFAQHQRIATSVDAEVFFAKPYHSWECGANKNTNGLISQFLPQSMPLDKLCALFVQAIEDNLNN